MKKGISLIFLVSWILISCEEYYRPVMDTYSGRLVIEAQITNNPAKNKIHLSRTRSFYDVLPPLEVTGAAVSLVDLNGNKTVARAYEVNTGYYVLNYIPESGKQYYLRVIIQNETFESSAVTMPPVPEVKKLYTEYVVRTVYVNSPGNDPQTFDYPGREIYADLPVSESLAYYRFKVRNLIEWSWDPNPAAKSVLPQAYGWYSYTDNRLFMLAGPKDYNQSNSINKYHFLTLSYNPFTYLFSDTLLSCGHIVMIEQYGTSKESYEFHQKLNNQFDATGSLFDPVQTQVEGNFHCSTSTSEKVYGFFDLNSFSQYRIYFYLNPPPGQYIERRLYKFPDIPYSGRIDAPQKTFGEPNPPPIQKPDWWEE